MLLVFRNRYGCVNVTCHTRPSCAWFFSVWMNNFLKQKENVFYVFSKLIHRSRQPEQDKTQDKKREKNLTTVKVKIDRCVSYVIKLQSNQTQRQTTKKYTSSWNIELVLFDLSINWHTEMKNEREMEFFLYKEWNSLTLLTLMLGRTSIDIQDSRSNCIKIVIL